MERFHKALLKQTIECFYMVFLEMISENKILNSCSVFYIGQKTEFEKFNCFFVDFLIYSFGRIKVISIVARREQTPDTTCQICFAYELTGFYMIRGGFTGRYFLIDYSYILVNPFYFVNAPEYSFKPSLSRIFCVNSSLKVLSPRYKGSSAHLFRTSSLCTFIIYRNKEIGFVAKFFSIYVFGPKLNIS